MRETGMTIAGFGSLVIKRGDYLTIVSTSYRVTNVESATGLSTRFVHSVRFVEWLHACVEDYLLWPLAGIHSRMRVRT